MRASQKKRETKASNKYKNNNEKVNDDTRIKKNQN